MVVNYGTNQQNATIQVNLLFLVSSTCFGRCFRPEFSTQPRHQPVATWVNTTKYCKYSQVLLMMDENIAQYM